MAGYPDQACCSEWHLVTEALWALIHINEIGYAIPRQVPNSLCPTFDGNSDGHGLGDGTCKQAKKFIAKPDWKPSRHSHSWHHVVSKGGSKGTLVTPTPFLVQILSFSCSFRHMFCQKIAWCSTSRPGLRIPLLETLDPPLILKQQIKLRNILSLCGLWEAPFMTDTITHILVFFITLINTKLPNLTE